MSRSRVDGRDIRLAIDSFGIEGLPVCVHSSLRSFGWVEGGAKTVVDGFLDAGCTVMVPTFTSGFEVRPPSDRGYPRNGLDCERQHWTGESRQDVFSPKSGEIDADMGAIPAAILGMTARFRGNHPSDSFAAVGPLARELIGGQTPFDVYAPFRALADRGGFVLLMGVNLTRMTLLHLAEEQSGRTLFRRWARDGYHRTVECRVGSCSEGFERLRPFLEPVEQTLSVGQSGWRMYPAADALDIAAAAIRANPESTHCPDPGCLRCRDAMLGGPIVRGA